MSATKPVNKWLKSNELQSELSLLTNILTKKQFTREQIAACSTTLLECLYLTVAHKDYPSLDQFREEVIKLFSDQLELVELCLRLVHDSDRDEQEQIDDLLREEENRVWQENANE